MGWKELLRVWGDGGLGECFLDACFVFVLFLYVGGGMRNRLWAMGYGLWGFFNQCYLLC